MKFLKRKLFFYSCYSTLFHLLIFTNLMDSPKVPDDTRSWESINIFLFSNGEQFSPPRKYHLSCDELRWWDATIRFLAQTQYGSTYSSIQLYTLDGKQIHSPLELRNDNAYVAVRSPEPFIWAGYEEYIIKASRSREKRQEKLPNSNTQIKLGYVLFALLFFCKKILLFYNILRSFYKNSNNLINSLMHPDIIATEKTKGDVTTINMVNQIPNKDQLKDNMGSELVYSGMPKVLKKNNIENDHQKRHGKEISKIDMLRKNQNLKPNKKDQLLVKRKNSALIRKSNDNSQIKQFISQNSLNAQVSNIKPKDKIKQKIKENINIKNVAKGENSNIPGNPTNQANNVKENNVQNLSNNVNENGENQKIDKKNVSTIKANANDSNMNSPNNKKSQEGKTDFVNKDKNINIYLDIKLNGCISSKPEGADVLKRCESNITLLSHKESQVNIDVILNKENISLIKNEPKIENSPDTEDNATENKDTSLNNHKFIVVYCKCNSKINTQSENCLNENTNLAFLLPVPEQGVCCQRDIKAQMLDKASQASSASSTNKTSYDQIDKLQDDTSFQKKVGENLNKENIEQTNTSGAQKSEPKQKSDEFTQTDMSNMLLQVVCERDGHYTFCLPPLDLLKKYSVDTP